MTSYYLVLLFFCTSLFGFSLGDSLKNGEKGDYVVYEEGKTAVLFHIFESSSNTLVIEEIHAPSSKIKRYIDDIPAWVENRAPHHTSWLLFELDKTTMKILEVYSASKKNFLKKEEIGSLFEVLAGRPLTLVEENLRKTRKKDKKIFSPTKGVKGKKLLNIEADLYQGSWPKDRSIIENAKLFLYFDKKEPTTFPYSIEVTKGGKKNVKFNQLDQGKGLHSFFTLFPRRLPEFLIGVEKKKELIRVIVRCPESFFPFDLAIQEVATKEIISLPYTLKKRNNDYECLVKKEDLKPFAVEGKFYRFKGFSKGIFEIEFDSYDLFEIK